MNRSGIVFSIAAVGLLFLATCSTAQAQSAKASKGSTSRPAGGAGTGTTPPALSPNPSAPIVNIQGTWTTSDGETIVIAHSPFALKPGDRFDSTLKSPTCCGEYATAVRSYYISGNILLTDPPLATISGKIQLCTKKILTACPKPLAPLWEAEFVGVIESKDSITIHYQSEYYDYKTGKDGKLTDCTCTKHPREDVTLTRLTFPTKYPSPSPTSSPSPSPSPTPAAPGPLGQAVQDMKQDVGHTVDAAGKEIDDAKQTIWNAWWDPYHNRH
jgi:hypothetical protein